NGFHALGRKHPATVKGSVLRRAGNSPACCITEKNCASTGLGSRPFGGRGTTRWCIYGRNFRWNEGPEKILAAAGVECAVKGRHGQF
ncbi:unnamed protein product, partial [Ectocarpus sp. 12 AP-2014]